MTIGEALRTARQRLESIDESAAITSRLLLSEIVGQSTAWLFARLEWPLTDSQQERFVQMLQQLADGYPLAYLIGKAGFYDRDFFVTPDVLIPRPETELLVEQAAAWARAQKKSSLRIVDIGTGSGIIAVMLAALLPDATLFATDISEQALAIARKNALEHTVQIEFATGDLLLPVMEQRPFDLITANLPYITTDALKSLAVAQHEPGLALDGGPDGLDFIRRLLRQAVRALKPGGMILLETGADQGQAALELAKQHFPAAVIEVKSDLAGFDRLLMIEDKKMVQG